MLRKKIAILTLAMFPVFAYAQDIVITNNTSLFGTGQIKSSPCSSLLGERGIAKPHGSLSIPPNIIKLFCQGNECDARIYASKGCTGDVMGTATVQADKGVISVKNNHPDRFKVTKVDNYNLSVEEVHGGGFMDWIKSLF